MLSLPSSSTGPVEMEGFLLHEVDSDKWVRRRFAISGTMFTSFGDGGVQQLSLKGALLSNPKQIRRTAPLSFRIDLPSAPPKEQKWVLVGDNLEGTTAWVSAFRAAGVTVTYEASPRRGGWGGWLKPNQPGGRSSAAEEATPMLHQDA